MQEPLVFDGVGTIMMRDTDGKLRLVDEKINSVMFAPQFAWTKVFGGQSGYPFHLTAQDLQDVLTIELPRYSSVLAEISQGAETKTGLSQMDEIEEGILTATGYTVKGIEKYGGTLVNESDEVHLKSSNGELTQLSRVATAPTAEQYTITTHGEITSAAANLNKNIIVTYKRSKEGTSSDFKGTRRPKPFKFTHRFELINDRTGKPVQVQLTVFKAIGGGTLNVGATRKTPTTSTLNLEVLEAEVTPDNPEGVAATIIFME